MKISVIIVDYHRLDFTKTCLESLWRCNPKPDEIIVVENGHIPHSESGKYYTKEFDNKRITYYLISLFNLGLAKAQNEGAKHATGDWLCFLNNDTIVRPDFFKHLLEGDGYIKGARMFDYSGKNELDSALSLDRFGCPAGKTGPMFYPDGMIFIYKEVFDELKGFDEQLFLYGEDRDLCWRAWLAGYDVRFVKDAIFYHKSDSSGNTNYNRRYLSERNIIYTMLKNFSTGYLFRRLPLYLLLLGPELLLLLFKNPKALVKSYIPSLYWNIKHLKETLKARKETLRRIKDKDLPFSKKIGKLHTLLTKGVPKFK